MSVTLRKRKLSNGRISLYLDIYHNGQRWTEFLKLYLTQNKQSNKQIQHLAETICAKKQIELNYLDNGLVPAARRKTNFVAYFEKLCAEKSKPWTSALFQLKAFTNGFVAFSAINRNWLEDFQKFLLTRVAPITAFGYFKKMKAALNIAVKDNIIQTNPANTVDHIKHSAKERQFLDFDEIRRLAATPCRNDQVKRAFLFSCFSGLRISDIENLTWGQIHGNKLQFTTQKTKELQYLPLSETAVDILHQNILSNEIPMPTKNVFHLPKRTIMSEILKKWIRDAGITKHITFHCARHSFATLSLTNDIDILTVSKLLGHTKIQTTLIYAKIIDKKKEEAVNKLPKLNIAM